MTIGKKGKTGRISRMRRLIHAKKLKLPSIIMAEKVEFAKTGGQAKEFNSHYSLHLSNGRKITLSINSD